MNTIVKRTIILLLLLHFHLSADAQYNKLGFGVKYRVSADSLLHRINNCGNVYDAILPYPETEIDPKDCYFNEELKSLLLTMLDEQNYVEYNNERRVKDSFGDEKCKIAMTRAWLIDHDKESIIDTVLSNAELFTRYLDTTIVDYTNRISSNWNISNTDIPYDIENLLSLIKWPEVYEEYHRQWMEDGKRLWGKRFNSMLRMHDPEAVSLYFAYFDNFIDSNNYSEEAAQKLENPAYLGLGSIAMELDLKSLKWMAPMKADWTGFCETCKTLAPFNVRRLDILCFYNMHFWNLLEIKSNIVREVIYSLADPEPHESEYKVMNMHMSEEDYKKIGNKIRENINEFRQELQPFIDEAIENEKYWKQNMPYYKVKDDNDCN